MADIPSDTQPPGDAMANPNDSTYACGRCNEEVQKDDDFCPNCGEVLADNVTCQWHAAQPAAGVCIICTRPCCWECGSRVRDRFLCHRHSGYEIYEGMARVLGTSDAAQVELAKDSLEKDSFHPFVYSRKASPLSIGGPDYTLFRASGEYDGHIINEYKLMVPCQEVERAEQKLRALGFMK